MPTASRMRQWIERANTLRFSLFTCTVYARVGSRWWLYTKFKVSKEVLMNRNSLLALGITARDLNPVNHGHLPDGITTDILWKLWDICIKFGSLQKDGGLIFHMKPLLMGIQRTPPLDSDTYFTVLKARDPNDSSECQIVRLSTVKVQIKWDQSLDPVEIEKYITQIDEFATSKNLKDGGTRMVYVG
jgi:hypothetical protein